MRFTLLLFLLTFLYQLASAQDAVTVIGYVYESNNRGYLQDISVRIDSLGIDTLTNPDGKFEIQVPNQATDYSLLITHRIFQPQAIAFNTNQSNEQGNIFLKIALDRKPGYLLDMSLIESVADPDQGGSYSIEGAHIEIYNNTTQKEEINIPAHESHNLRFLLEQGNEYIFMIRKEGYYTKRLRANVNVNGCILCMEGFGTVEPGVTENLTEENTKGVLLANVPLKKMMEGEKLKLDRIYYDLGKATLRPQAKEGLDELIKLLHDNPNIIVELSSHTDARGSKSFNKDLSQRRANSVVNYIKNHMAIDDKRITAKGYGESQPTNSCIDGVECSEEMHQQNRRTELLILDILIDKSAQQRSLASIMQERNFDEILEANQEAYVESDAPETEQPTNKTAATPKTIPMQYTGYKVEVVAEKGEITLEHPIFYAFEEVFLDLHKGFNSFMIGDFASKAAAQNKQKSILKNFPSAKVVYYKEGIRQ